MNATDCMHEKSSWRGRLTLLATIALALPFAPFGGKVQAQPFGEVKTIQGRVQSLTAAPMGEVDGAVLDDGTVVHWPPHLADRFTAIVAKNDRVRVVGRMETGPAGDTHLEAETVTNLRTNASAENDFGPPPPPPNRPARRVGAPPPRPLARRGVVDPRAGQATTAQGRVRSLTTAPMGEVDGDFDDSAPSRATTGEVERRLKNLEDQIAQLREEIRRLRDEL